MHTLILLAHPETNSLNAQLARCAQETLECNGNSVELVDLYREAFDPLEGEHHYAKRLNETFFSALSEQGHASDLGTLPLEVRRAIDQLDRADLVVFQFPLWWWAMPALLKGWIDRVFVWGEVYTSKMRYCDKGRFRGKRAFLSVTTGAPAPAFGPDGRAGNLDLILWPIHFSLSYVGFKVLPPHRSLGVISDSSQADPQLGDLSLRLEALKTHIDELESLEPIQFNGSQDWDNQGRLRPDATSFSPFIQHLARRDRR
ncbi:NAD(P)H-dependent oxidoreductase [Mesorhizobium sp. M0621]|uniref:NAD(P)H-dependent oxidoreductase n=1 Tax=Mesorhizobium sp. M0621 TaxID=2956974 RepID=UPI00333BE11A